MPAGDLLPYTFPVMDDLGPLRITGITTHLRQLPALASVPADLVRSPRWKFDAFCLDRKERLIGET
ncbi:hypothetical protein LTR28_009000, partial [Elasticomyces elasticus]